MNLNQYQMSLYAHKNLKNSFNTTKNKVNLQSLETSDSIETVNKNVVIDNQTLHQNSGEDAGEFVQFRKSCIKEIIVKKDPLNIHYNVYYIKLVNIEFHILELLKTSILDYLILKIGKPLGNNSAEITNDEFYDIIRSALKIVNITVPKTSHATLTECTLECVTLSIYAILYDKSFSGEIDGGSNHDTNIIATNIPTTPSTAVPISGSSGFSGVPKGKKKGWSKIQAVKERQQQILQMATNAANKAGIDPGIFASIAWIESNMGAINSNSTSSAQGVFQIVGDTWDGLIKEFGPQYGYNSNTNRLTNVQANINMAAQLVKKSIKDIERTGKPVNALYLYAHHLMGSPQFVKVMKAPLNTPLDRVMSQKAMDANVNFWKNGKPKTTGELLRDYVAVLTDMWGEDMSHLLQGGGIDITSTSYDYGDMTYIPNDYVQTSVTRLDSFELITGKHFIANVIASAHAKYDIYPMGFNERISPFSNYMYPLISIPALNLIDYLDYAHTHYPPYFISVPWILDDMHAGPSPLGTFNIGNLFYKEINLLNIDALSEKTFLDFAKNGSKRIQYFMTDAVRYYEKEIVNYYNTSNFTFTDPKGTVTNFPPRFAGTQMLVPDESDKVNITMRTVNVDASENISIEANYDAPEFQQRLNYLYTHLDIDPKMIKIEILGDYPSYIDFGYKYKIYEEAGKRMYATPYQIINKFSQIGDGLVLNTETIMFTEEVTS